RPGRSTSASRVTTSRSAPLCPSSCSRSSASPRSSSCAACASAETRPEDGGHHGNHRSPCAGRTARQHLAHSPQGAHLVLCIPDRLRHLLSYAARLHVRHLAQVERRDRGGGESVVRLSPVAR